MTQKELNMAILNKLYDAAFKMFDNMVFPYGRFKAYEVYNYFKRQWLPLEDRAAELYDQECNARHKGKYDKVNERREEREALWEKIKNLKRMYDEYECEISVDTFHCHCSGIRIFTIIQQFEVLCNIPTNKKAMFCKDETNDPRNH